MSLPSPTCFRVREAFFKLQLPIPYLPEVEQREETRQTKPRKTITEQDKAIDEIYSSLVLRQQLDLDFISEKLIDTAKDFDDEFIYQACAYVLDSSLKSLTSSDFREVLFVINWMYMGSTRLMIAPSDGFTYRVKTEKVPFSFRYLCKLFGYDFAEIRDQALLNAFQFHKEKLENPKTLARYRLFHQNIADLMEKTITEYGVEP